MILKSWKILNPKSTAKRRMHCFIFPHCIFVLQNLNIPIFHSKSTKVVWSHQDYSCFSKIKMCFPLSLSFCWAELEKGNLHALLCGKQLDRPPGNWQLGNWPGLLPNAWWAGKFDFYSKDLKFWCTFPMKRGQMRPNGPGKLGNIWS